MRKVKGLFGFLLLFTLLLIGTLWAQEATGEVGIVQTLKDYIVRFFAGGTIFKFFSGLVLVLLNWVVLRFINLSKRATKYQVITMLVRQAFLWALNGEDKKARVKAMFRKICENNLFGKIFGKVTDEQLDLFIEDVYQRLKKEIAAPLAPVSSPQQ